MIGPYISCMQLSAGRYWSCKRKLWCCYRCKLLSLFV